MKRKLFFLERFIYGNGQQSFNGVFHVRLKGAFTTEAMRHALNAVQAKHDLLQAAITTDATGTPWFVCDGSTPEIPLEIIERHGDDDWLAETQNGWATLFPVSTGPLAKLVWLRAAQVSDLLLVFHHCICDGASALAITQEILLVLEQPAADIGKDKMVAPVMHWVPAHVKRPFWQHLKNIIASSAARLLFHAAALLSTAKKPQVIPAEKNYLLHWKLSKEQSAALLAGCKAQGVTVNTALTLAWMRAFQAVKQLKQFKVTCPVNIRKLVPEIKDDALFAFAVSIRFNYDSDNTSPFWEKARQMQQQATRQMNRIKAYNQLMQLEYFHPLIRPMHQVMQRNRVNNDFLFSNMGPLPVRQQYKSFEVDTINTPSAMGTLGNPTGIVTTTYNGRMDFGFVSNSSLLSKEEAWQIKEKAMNLLLQETPATTTAPALPVWNAAL